MPPCVGWLVGELFGVGDAEAVGVSEGCPGTRMFIVPAVGSTVGVGIVVPVGTPIAVGVGGITPFV